MNVDIEKLKLNLENTEDKKSKLIILNEIALEYLNTSHFEKSKLYTKEALDILRELNDLENKMKFLDLISKCNYCLGVYEEAMKSSVELMELAEENNKLTYLSSAYNIMGLIAYRSKDFIRAKDYLTKGLNLRRELVDKSWAADSLLNLGVVYREQKKINNSLDSYREAMTIYEKIQDKSSIAMIFNNIGNIYLRDEKKYEKALEYFKKSLEIKEKMDNKRGIINSFSNIAVTYSKLENYEKSFFYHNKAVELAESVDEKILKQEVYQEFSTTCEVAGDETGALKYYKKQTELQNEIFNESSKIKVLELQLSYEKTQSEHEKEIYRLKNIELVKAKQLIEEQRNQLILQNEKLKKSINLNDLIFDVLSHNLKNKIWHLMSFIDLLSEQWESKENKLELIEMVSLSGDNAMKSLNRILSANRINMVDFKLDLIEICIQDVLKEYAGKFKIMVEKKNISLDLKMTEDEIICLIDVQRFYEIIENLISNSVKFTKEGGFIEVTLSKVKNLDFSDSNIKSYAQIQFKDNGIGIPEDKIQGLFNRFTTAGRVGISGEVSSGLGLSIVKRLVELHNGRISVESKENIGTTFKILIPNI